MKVHLYFTIFYKGIYLKKFNSITAKYGNYNQNLRSPASWSSCRILQLELSTSIRGP